MSCGFASLHFLLADTSRRRRHGVMRTEDQIGPLAANALHSSGRAFVHYCRLRKRA